MIAWLLIIVALAVFQIIALMQNFPESYVYISTILVLVAALGLLYRAWTEQKKLSEKGQSDKELSKKDSGAIKE